MTREPFLDCCCQCSYRWGEPLLTHFSTGDPLTLVGSFGSVSCGVTAPFLWVLVCTRFCLCLPSLESLFPPVLCKAFKVRFPGDSQALLSDPHAGKPDVGFRTFTTVGELLQYHCSPVSGSPTWQVWDLILLWLHTSYPLTSASSLSLDVEYPFLVGSSTLLSMVVQQLVVILVLLQEEMSTCPSTPPSSMFLFYLFILFFNVFYFLVYRKSLAYFIILL